MYRKIYSHANSIRVLMMMMMMILKGKKIFPDQISFLKNTR